MAKTVVVGTQDVIGAVVTYIDSGDVTLVKDGRTYYLELEYESWYHTCMCDGPCCCSVSGTSYLVARADAI